MGFIVIEGLDGSGKSTQMRLLKDYLEKKSISCKYLHFPRLEEGIYGKLVARFLRGEMGPIDQVDPYLVALIFAGDRTEAASQIRSWIDEGYLVIADRYVYSNIAFQCAKIEDREESDRLRDWILDFEFVNNALPRPGINIYLNVPFEFTRHQLNNQRNGDDREYLKGERDIHEENLDFQEKVRRTYISLHHYVDDLKLIECTGKSGEMLSPEAISKLIVNQIDI